MAHQGSEDDSVAGSQGSPRPPGVQCGNVPVADGLLAGGLGADGTEWDGEFDEMAAASLTDDY